MWNQRDDAEEGDREDEGDHNTPGAERLKETHLLQELEVRRRQRLRVKSSRARPRALCAGHGCRRRVVGGELGSDPTTLTV